MENGESNMAGPLALSNLSILFWMLWTQSINIKYSIQLKSGKSFRNMGADFEVESRFVQGMKSRRESVGSFHSEEISWFPFLLVLL